MAEYQLTATDTVLRTADQAWIPNDPNNIDRQQYNTWLANGGVPDPYVAPPTPPPQPDPLAEAQRANARLDAGVTAAQDSAAAAAPPAARGDPVDPSAPVTQDQLAALQIQVDNIQQAMTAMLQAQAGA